MIGRVVGAVLGARMAPPRELPPGALPPDVTLRKGRVIPWIGGVLAGMNAPAAAVTLGRTIVVRPGVRLTPALLAHELTHVRQWRSDPLFPVRYAAATLRHGYRDNPYEVEAREVEASSRPPQSGEVTF